ncbi:uncharacterized protein EAF01_007297 [Botrytis porri]|uniref:uncharacterized protein n=1 Tax=Botrytis porri TaxID=87229 RepID=UPI0018FF5BCB|nr:uncharacterized protein EAF01_007297 [Botrytis porri]KAF7901999.1 hypothetical protein EAF01_007297 [Botrytis porri]
MTPMDFPANNPVASSLANTDIRHIDNVPSKPHSHKHILQPKRTSPKFQQARQPYPPPKPAPPSESRVRNIEKP